MFSIQVTCVWEKKFFFHSVNEALALVGLNLRQSDICLWLGSIEEGYQKHKKNRFSPKRQKCTKIPLAQFIGTLYPTHNQNFSQKEILSQKPSLVNQFYQHCVSTSSVWLIQFVCKLVFHIQNLIQLYNASDQMHLLADLSGFSRI